LKTARQDEAIHKNTQADRIQKRTAFSVIASRLQRSNPQTRIRKNYHLFFYNNTFCYYKLWIAALRSQ
jgi:hypothetical protein